MSPRYQIPIVLACLVPSLPACARADELQRAYLDARQCVHVVTHARGDSRVSAPGAIALAMAPDRGAVAWIGIAEPGQLESDDLRVFSGDQVRRIDRGPRVRAFRFAEGGKRIAVRFAGFDGRAWQELYDTATMTVLESFDEADPERLRRPAWAIDGDARWP